MKPVIMSAMANFNRGNRPSGNRSFGKPRFNDRQEMFSATCANCGKQCEVPFRPTGSKPVLCRDCFQQNRGSDMHRSESRSFDRPRFNRDDNRSSANDYTAQFEMLNAKMDKILNLLQNATEPAPLESNLNEEIIEEIVDEVQEENEETPEEKPKKTRVSKKKTTD